MVCTLLFIVASAGALHSHPPERTLDVRGYVRIKVRSANRNKIIVFDSDSWLHQTLQLALHTHWIRVGYALDTAFPSIM